MNAITPLHILLVLIAAFLIGARVFRETQPRAAAEDEQTDQLQRLAKAVSIGLVVLMIAVILGRYPNMFHAAKAIQ